MSADTPATNQAATEAEVNRFVKIPHALPGQEYKAPRNFRNPLLRAFYQLAVVVMALALPAAPGVIFAMILFYSKAIAMGFLWIWIPMIIIVETIAIGVAIGVAREALGYAGVSYSPTRR